MLWLRSTAGLDRGALRWVHAQWYGTAGRLHVLHVEGSSACEAAAAGDARADALRPNHLIARAVRAVSLCNRAQAATRRSLMYARTLWVCQIAQSGRW